jgi:hypothetical protein
MGSRAPVYVLALHGAIALSVVVAATVLCFHGSLDAAATTGIIGAALGLAGGASSSLGSLGAVVNGHSITSPEAETQREVTLRAAMGANPTPVSPPSAADTAAMRHDAEPA